jgi:hypothetical protein
MSSCRHVNQLDFSIDLLDLLDLIDPNESFLKATCGSVIDCGHLLLALLAADAL